MISYAILLALSGPVPAPKPCPPEVGKSERYDVQFHETINTGNSSKEETNRLRQQGLHRLADSEDRSRLKYEKLILADKVRLGYAYLDGKCYAEARKTFNEVWSKTDPEFAIYAQQAREGLNLMNSKGQ